MVRLALEAHRDIHEQDNRTGHPAWNRQLEAKAELGAQEAMAGGPYGLDLGPLGPATTAGALLKIHGVNSGVSGALGC